jgi:hypothetical protein
LAVAWTRTIYAPVEVSSGVTREDGSVWIVWRATGVNPVVPGAIAVSVKGALPPEQASGREGRAPTLGELFSSHMNRSTSVARAAVADAAGASCACLT